MKKSNRRRDILLQTKRERQRIRKQTKTDRDAVHDNRTIADQSWFFKRFLPRLSFTEKITDRRKRYNTGQEQGDR